MRVRGGCARSIGEIGGPITYVQVKYKGRLLSPEQMNSRASKAPKGKGGQIDALAISIVSGGGLY